MSSSSRLMLVAVLTAFTGPRLLEVLGRHRWIRIRRRQVGERARRGHRRLVDAVADDGTIPGVDQQREDRVHHIVVEGPPAAGLVWAGPVRGSLDLEE